MIQDSQSQLPEETCPYCEGQGYFQLLLGGSETCASCAGDGKLNNKVNCTV